MQRFSRWVLVLATATLAACNTMAPIQNVSDVSVAPQANKALTADQVRGAIVRAGAALGWIMKDAGPGQLHGTLLLRTHTAEVNIPYSATSYSIKYKSSSNLQEANGNIHRNYNGWITNLNRGINAQLAAS
jgi:predicted small secreted protein